MHSVDEKRRDGAASQFYGFGPEIEIRVISDAIHMRPLSILSVLFLGLADAASWSFVNGKLDVAGNAQTQVVNNYMHY